MTTNFSHLHSQKEWNKLLTQLQSANARLVRIETRQAVMMMQMGLTPQGDEI